MEKTKLGISIGLMAAGIFALTLAGGYIPAILLLGYVLIREENQWLRWCAVRAVALALFFSVINVFIDFVPDIANCVVSLINVFAADPISLPSRFNRFLTVVDYGMGFWKTITFLILIFKALKLQTVATPVDGMVGRHMLQQVQQQPVQQQPQQPAQQ